MLSDAEWLRDSRSHLVRLKEEPGLSDAEIATVERGIAALETLFASSPASSR
jgi:hypothetical protein